MRHFKLGLVLLFACLSLTAQAARVFVEATTGTVSASDLTTTTELIRGAVRSQGGHQSVGTPGEAEVLLRPKLMKLGNSYILSIEKLKGQQVEFSSQLKAAQIEEMDRVAVRVTRAVLDEKAIADDARVGDVTDTEVREGTNRKQALKGWYFGLGPAWLSELGTSGTGYYFDLGYAFDLNHLVMKIAYDASYSSGASVSALTLNGNYMFSEAALSPYVGASFGIGSFYATNSSLFSSTTGFAAGVGGGVQMLRTSSFQVEIGAQMMFILKQPHPNMFALRLNFYVL